MDEYEFRVSAGDEECKRREFNRLEGELVLCLFFKQCDEHMPFHMIDRNKRDIPDSAQYLCCGDADPERRFKAGAGSDGDIVEVWFFVNRKK
jgi:hypothetical protein